MYDKIGIKIAGGKLGTHMYRKGQIQAMEKRGQTRFDALGILLGGHRSTQQLNRYRNKQLVERMAFLETVAPEKAKLVDLEITSDEDGEK